MRSASLAASLSAATFVALTASCSSESQPVTGANTDGGRRPYPSFQDDVVPIVRTSCALTACHGSKESNLGILLTNDPDQIFTELQKESPTAKGKKLIVPGDPAASFLMAKMDGKQSSFASACAIPNCGTEMPPGEPAGTLLTEAERSDVRLWIEKGAKKD